MSDYADLERAANAVAILETLAWGWATLATTHPTEAAEAQAALNDARAALQQTVRAVYGKWAARYAPEVARG